MMRPDGGRRIARAVATAIVAAAAAALATAVSTASAAPAARTAPAVAGELVGTFGINGGGCGAAGHGSYFQMLDSQGKPVANASSTCADINFSSLEPGSDGGLLTGTYQPAPSPAFDGSGNGLASRMTRPTPFFGKNFSLSTESTDPQTGAAAPPPSIIADGAGTLSGNLSALGAMWGKLLFNQGSPKPSGVPGATTGPSGTYDAATGGYTLDWTSEIRSNEGNSPFEGFKGVWHLEGTFTAQGGAPAPAAEAPAVQNPAQPAAPAGGATQPAAGGTDANAAGGTDIAGQDVNAVAASGPTGTASADRTTAEGERVEFVVDKGWRPATWLVVLIALLGVAAVVTLVVLSRPTPKVSP